MSKVQVANAKTAKEAEQKVEGVELRWSAIDAGDAAAKAAAQQKGFATFVGELHIANFHDVAYIDGCVSALLADYQEKDTDNERLVCCTKMLEAIGSNDVRRICFICDGFLAPSPPLPPHVRF